MDNKECEVCSKLIKEKYKHYTAWKVIAIIFICLTVVFAILFFANGNLMVEETVENNIVVENGGGSNENNVVTGEGSTISGTITTESNIGVIIFACVIVLTGGVVCGCYIVSQKKSDK